jgi:hypothetical protein
MDVDNLYFDETDEVEEEDAYKEAQDDQTKDQVEEDQVENNKLDELCMQLNVVMTPLQQQCFTAGQCLKCGKTRHFAKQCNVKPGQQTGFKRTNQQTQRQPQRKLQTGVKPSGPMPPPKINPHWINAVELAEAFGHLSTDKQTDFFNKAANF